MLLSLQFYCQDTTLLKEIDVTAQKINFSELGKKTHKLDSNALQQFVYNTVADALSLNSSVFIKSYGPGALTSTSLRGGNASQTAVLWNGFNIQNAMLGQIDLTLLPTVLFDQVNVEYGGSSSLWGTGAVAGSLHLLNKPKFNNGVSTKVNVGSGSFGLFNASTNVEFSKAKFFSSTKAYIQNSINNFIYKDTLNKERLLNEQKHASYSFKGVLQEFKFILNKKQTLSVNAWYNLGYRQIPSNNLVQINKAYQKDNNLKVTVNWNYIGAKLNSSIKAAVFNDVVVYNDSLISLNSKSTVKNIIIENENIINWGKNHSINFGANLTSGQAISDNYNGVKKLTKIAFLVGNKFSLIKDKLIIYPVARAEYFSVGKLPVTGNLSIEYKVFKNITAKVNGAKVYRQPTFNELYWQPGGNINLFPEQGYTFEGDLIYTKKINGFLFSLSGAAFYRMIDNWILWLPGANSFPTPVNVQQVFSRGTETSCKLEYVKNKFRVTTNVFTAYTLSTVNSSSQENGNTKEKQLIYTPRYTVNSNLTLAYNNTFITYYHQYVGYRFTSSDNTQWLLPYNYSSLRFNLKGVLGKETKMIVYAACNNLFNQNYTVVSGRFMPLRNFEIGISLLTNKQNKNKI
jgi:iron complex outermembrane receptor protein